MIEGYVPKDQRKKVLLLSDDIRFFSGIATMAREMVIGTCHKYNWVNLGGAGIHPDHGKVFDISQATSQLVDVPDPSIFVFAINGYGDRETVMRLIKDQKPDILLLITDPRYWIHIFKAEHEIRKKIPIVYLNIWDDTPAPLYNKPYYESCDALMAISKQTYNINKIVLGEKAKDKIIEYVPHCINTKLFFPIDQSNIDLNNKLQIFKERVTEGKSYDFIFLYNARNIRRKSVSDLILAYKLFCDEVGKEKSYKCLLLLHTDAVDENGTDLPAVIEYVNTDGANIKILEQKFSPEEMNLLYNISDVTCLVSSNEGWGLSLTESMMVGKMIIATVTGGMQDQMRFEDENGKWLDFDINLPSNHFGTYKKHGEWAVPIYPNNISLIGSPLTPYIYDDRADFRDIKKALLEVYNLTPEERDRRGMLGRQWVLSDESMMTANKMCDNVLKTLDKLVSTWKSRSEYEFIKFEKLKSKKSPHKLIY